MQLFHFIEIMSISNDHSFERISDALMETVASVFGEDILLKLAHIVPSGADGEVQLARLQIINWGYKHVRDGLEQRTLPLSTLPSLEHAMLGGRPISSDDYEVEEKHRFEDWDLQFRTYGVRSFMTVPLVYAGQV